MQTDHGQAYQIFFTEHSVEMDKKSSAIKAVSEDPEVSNLDRDVAAFRPQQKNNLATINKASTTEEEIIPEAKVPTEETSTTGCWDKIKDQLQHDMISSVSTEKFSDTHSKKAGKEFVITNYASITKDSYIGPKSESTNAMQANDDPNNRVGLGFQ